MRTWTRPNALLAVILIQASLASAFRAGISGPLRSTGVARAVHTVLRGGAAAYHQRHFGDSAEAAMVASSAGARGARLHEPATREAYGANLAQYLVDLNDSRSVFDFCGGMMFQLCLTDALRTHLSNVAGGGGGGQPVVCDATTNRMAKMTDYEKSAFADNMQLFHGREIRKVPTAEGGMGFVLQLSLAGGGDPEGWTGR